MKYSFNGSAWVNETNVALNANNNVVNPTGLICVQDPSNPNDVDITVSGTNGIYTYEDVSGSTGAIPANAFTDLVAPSTNEAFYGIAVAPAAAVPEPSSILLVVVGFVGIGLAAWRRRRAS